MEMDELFYREPYRRACTAEVVRCVERKDGFGIVLSDTVFYPEGGGQPGDTGMLDGIRVKDTRRIGGEIVHLTDSPAEPGRKVEAVIDWERRFDHMQNHTGEHIVSGIVHRRFGYENVGFHMGEVIQIDFDGMLSEEDLLQVEQEANETVWQDLPVEISFPDSKALAELEYRSKKELEGRIRIVRIGGCDTCACCGTHTARTGEVGMITILSWAKHGTGVRVEMACGQRALRMQRKISAENREISRLLCARREETAAAVSSLLQRMQKAEQTAASLRRRILEMRWEGTAEEMPLVIWFEEGMQRNDLTRWADRLVHEKHAGIAALLNREENGAYSYVILSAEKPLRETGKKLHALLGGRGGGKDLMLQGSFAASQEEIRKELEEYLYEI